MAEEETYWGALVTDGPVSKPAAEVIYNTPHREPAKDVLEVSSVDLLIKENSKVHNTNRYELVHGDTKTAVFRRGEPFSINIKFNRPYDPDEDLIRLTLDYGANPLLVKGTKGIITINLTTEECWPDRSQWWDARIDPNEKDPVLIEVRSPANVPVGIWTLHVETRSRKMENDAFQKYTHPQQIYILFNPWLKEDAVYMEDKVKLDEYVLNDIGKIWVGPYSSTRGRHWVFGQFEKNVLPAVMLMLERAHTVPANLGNPIIISRIISKMVNSADDLGVLRGRWDGNYKEGVAPGAWTGSVEILKRYLKTKKEVLYGQCWVFAGVTTTVCRALGIPSRVVSNLVSAHDANASLTIDKYYTKKGEELEFDPNNPQGEDSVWNFHVWNEAWMARPDLPKGYGGWQAIDATPQETSDGIFQCGPASLEAIKRGNVGLKYDVPFVLSSVNADLIRWQEDETNSLGFRKISTDTKHIGRMLLTKLPLTFDSNGDTDVQNITSLYKDNEGTQMERTALYNAVRGSVNAKKFFSQPGDTEENLVFRLVDLESVPIGQNFSIKLTIDNKTDKTRVMDVVLSASSVYYNGINANLIKKASGKFSVKANHTQELILTVSSNEYLDKLVEYCNMKIFAVITVLDTNQTWSAEDEFEVTKPSLEIKPLEAVNVGKSTTVEFSFKNPLDKKLTECKLRFEGPPILTKVVSVRADDVGEYEEVKIQGTITPKKSGKYTLIGVFSSHELIDITGSTIIDVLPA